MEKINKGKNLLVAVTVIYFLMEAVLLVFSPSMSAIVRVLLSVTIFYFLFKGKNWARILMSALFAISIILIVIIVVAGLYVFTSFSKSSLGVSLFIGSIGLLIYFIFSTWVLNSSYYKAYASSVRDVEHLKEHSVLYQPNQESTSTAEVDSESSQVEQ